MADNIEIRKSKTITDKDEINRFISLTDDDITTSFIMETFGDFDGNNNQKYNPYDVITIPAGGYGGKLPNGTEKRNKNEFTTTLGRFIFNKYFIESEPELLAFIGYVNADIGKKKYGKIFDSLGYAVLENKISIDVYKRFCKRSQKFMPYVSILAPSYSDNMLTITKKIDLKKQQLIKENKEGFDKGDVKVVDKVSKELLEYARGLMENDPAMDMFMSGAGGSFENNFKNMFIMRGSVQDPDPRKSYNIITSNYVDGISKEEYSKIANTLAAGPYSRAKKTELGGYWEKLFLPAFEHIVLLDPGSDCGTTRHITMDVTDKNISSIMYCYVINDDGSLTEITSDNKDTFIGKRVKLRFSSMCEAKDGICNKCAGNLFYRLGIRNIGASTPQIPSKLKVLSMKLFHDDQLNFTEMDPMKAFCINE